MNKYIKVLSIALSLSSCIFVSNVSATGVTQEALDGNVQEIVIQKSSTNLMPINKGGIAF